MHAKTLIFDEQTVLTGSVNMTHNGLEKNKETLFRITEPETVREVLADFEATWETASVVSQEQVALMILTWQKAEDAKAEKAAQKAAEAKSKPRSRSAQSLSSRSVSRSLSSELELVDEKNVMHNGTA